MARPKGIVQNRDESKYWLPDGVTLKPDQTTQYRKDTKLIFIDSQYGEFISYFKALQDANASTHKLAVQKRREQTNMLKYGGTNPSHSKEVRNKAKNTMIERYGVEHALYHSDFLKKALETTRSNFGVNNPMQSNEIKEKMHNTVNNIYGTSNVMKTNQGKQLLRESLIEKYGVDNYSKTPEFLEKLFQSKINNKTAGRSKGELDVESFIKNLGLNPEHGFFGGNNPKSVDIKIKELNIAIEYNGVYWHSEANSNIYPNYHLEKTLVAEQKGYRLIQIFDFEWENRNKQVKSYLRSALNKNSRIVYARNTKIVELSKSEANNFLDNYHILGKVRHDKAYGLKLNDELLALVTIGKHHRTNKEIVLNRYVGKDDVTVIGGLSKLANYANKIHGTMFTWIDLRFSNGNNWIKNGWKLVHRLPPDYFYLDCKTNKIINKQARRKKIVNTPKDMTEHEHALLDGLARIYDCGKIKLIYTRSG